MDLKTLQIVCQVLLCCFSGIYNIPVEQFYGFGAENNDNKCPLDDDFSIEVPISANFPYFGHGHSQVYVNENGEISTNQQDDSYDDWSYSNGIRRIMPYYSDISTFNGGDIWYRETTESELLQRATSEIRTAFPWHNSFTATWMFVTTWDNVNSYDNEASKRNTFQGVLVTDEVTSFIIFLYARTEWGVANSDDYAMAGYFSGDGVNNLLFPESWNETAVNTLSGKTNVGIPGMFIFDVGGPTVAAGPCPGGIVITNGSVEYSDSGEEAINITCNDGFELVGDGVWGDSTAVCEEIEQIAITCPLQEIDHGFVTGENNNGDSITFGCDPGYALVCGDDVMSCGEDGLWDGITPFCIWRGKSNVAVRDFKGDVEDNQGHFCSKLRERNGNFGQRPE